MSNHDDKRKAADAAEKKAADDKKAADAKKLGLPKGKEPDLMGTPPEPKPEPTAQPKPEPEQK